MERPPTLLLIEDERMLRGLVADFLRAARYQVIEAGDGPEGVAQFESQRPFDLVLVDLNLPGFSGVEVCRQVRRLEPEQSILVASAVVLPDAAERLERLGVGNFLGKPYHPSMLLSRVQALTGIDARRQSASA